jgi:hypothetical protein
VEKMVKISIRGGSRPIWALTKSHDLEITVFRY